MIFCSKKHTLIGQTSGLVMLDTRNIGTYSLNNGLRELASPLPAKKTFQITKKYLHSCIRIPICGMEVPAN